MKIIQEFIHLFDNNDDELDNGIELSSLRQLIVKRIRENIQSELELNDLDVKISLLVKNRVSIEEVVQSTRKYKKNPNNLEPTSTFEKTHNPFIQRPMDKEARKKLEGYQQLFYLLQTQPAYLSKLMFTLNKKNGGLIIKFLEQVILTLFGYAQNSREEYLLLNLIKVRDKFLL